MTMHLELHASQDRHVKRHVTHLLPHSYIGWLNDYHSHLHYHIVDGLVNPHAVLTAPLQLP